MHAELIRVILSFDTDQQTSDTSGKSTKRTNIYLYVAIQWRQNVLAQCRYAKIQSEIDITTRFRGII